MTWLCRGVRSVIRFAGLDPKYLTDHTLLERCAHLLGCSSHFQQPISSHEETGRRAISGTPPFYFHSSIDAERQYSRPPT